VNATRQEASLASEEATANLKVKSLRAQDVQNGTGDIVRLMEAEEALYTSVLKQLDLVQLLTFKKFELTLDSGQLSNLACVDGGCADLPMEPVAYINPVDVPMENAPAENTLNQQMPPEISSTLPAAQDPSPAETVAQPTGEKADSHDTEAPEAGPESQPSPPQAP
jgi:hypothetical protein